ncbi:MAG: phosphate/phosphite/phosphonate ABC transporter substrate-binding protein [Deltaproteobacteria bacterium]|nr:phosphate/phosphite/phosphonate ABC transporter substrate-binding protein [Deltaproteobacteria bacterium]
MVCLLLCLAAPAAIPVAAAEQPEELLIGIEPEHNIFEHMKRYRLLAGYLSDQLGVKVNLTIMSRYGEVIKRFKTLKLDGAFLTSYTATMGIKELGLEPLVNPVNLSGESTSQGYIFVRKDSGIRDVNSHDSAIFAVLDGRADIGAAKNTVFNKLVHDDPSIQQELEIIAQSPKVPEITLCIRKEIDPELREKLSAVLLQMDQTPQGREVLKQFKALRFVKSYKTDFVRVEEMAQEARAAIAEHGRD